MSKGIALHWRLIPRRYNLIGTECGSCDEKFFPPRQLCPNCRRVGKMKEIQFSGNGEIYSYTEIHSPSKGFEAIKPYIIGVIKLEEGPLLAAQIVDCSLDEVEIGKKVEMVFRKVTADGESGIIRYAYKFKIRN